VPPAKCSEPPQRSVLTEQQPSAAALPSPNVPRSFLRKYVWWIVGVALVLFSAGFVHWADTRPGYDPYGWLIWGYQAIHLNLDLGGAPSWKPLPLLFTAPYSVFGHAALWLWMVTCVSVSFAGSIFAGRIAFRVVDQGGTWRWQAIVAAIVAGAGLYGIQDTIITANVAHNSYFHYILSVQSDPMIVTMVLAAIDFHMKGYKRWVLAMLVLASLGRPEVWPFLGLYALWCWREFPELRRYTVIAVLIVPLLWFGIPTITNGRPLVAGDLAQGSPRELHQNKIVGTIERFKALNLWPVWTLMLIGIAWAWFKRNRLILVLSAAIFVWLVIEVAFALHGWPAVPRYVFEPAAAGVLIAAIALGWLLSVIPREVKLPAWAGVIVAVALAGALIPGTITRARNEHKDLSHERQRTKVINRLSGLIDRLGGPSAVLACGRPVTNVAYVSILGWLANQNDGKVGHRPQFELHNVYPIVLFTELRNGWASYPWHTASANVTSCQRMKALWVFTGRHPNGILAPNTVPPKLTSYKGAQALKHPPNAKS
jgi:hypothetical protein